ncbi:MAG: trimethylamine corrinoid protein 2, partial [Planctomycetota bacterium]
WFDAERIARQALHGVLNQAYLGDALPIANPNLGPEIFSAFFGCELDFGERTSWSIPNLTDWDEVDAVRFSGDNAFWKRMNEMTDTFLAIGRNHFYTGITDLHPGGDAIAAFRDPQHLAMDMIDCPERVQALLERVNEGFFRVYTHFADKLTAAGQAITCWAGIVSTKRWYVPSNDFSCMLSTEMFDQVFLPGIAEECRFLEASIYHLDGPGALQHLDSLLAIPDLDAIQWVYGAGNGRATDWLDVYRRCQDAGKGVQIHAGVDELDTLIDALRPEGVWLGVGVPDRDAADAVLKKVAAWTR